MGAEPLPRRLRARAGGAAADRRRRGQRARSGGRARRARGAARRDGRRCERRRRRGRLGPADRRATRGRAATAAPGGRRGPREPRGLPRARRLRGAASRAGARAAGGDRRVDRLEAARARRRGVPGGPQVGGRGERRGAAALRRLQRRRVRAGHVQGSRADGARPVRADRGDDHRRRDHRRGARLPLHPPRVPAGDRAPRGRDRAGRGGGLLGDDVLGSGRRFAIEIRRGAGAYICGEETALFNSIEGYRAEPRSKPPYPTQAGLFGKPTLVNNVETLANVPAIVLEGGAAFAETGPRTRRARSCSASRAASPAPACTRCRSARPCAI